MDRRKALKVAGGGGLAAILGSQTAPAFAQAKKEWRMAMTWQRNAPLLSAGAVAFADFINKTSSTLSIRIAAAGEIVPPFQTMGAVANGTVQVGSGYATYWAGQHPAVQFLGPIPFGLTSQEYNAWYHYGGGEALVDEVYAKLGVKGFQVGQTSVQSAGWFNKEIRSVADYKGLKMRVTGIGGKVVQGLGGTPVSMPLGEVPQAMQSGAIDAIEFVGPMNDLQFGLHKIAKYYYWPGWLEPCGMYDVFINADAWGQLSSQEKELVRGAAFYATQLSLSEHVAKNAIALVQLTGELKVNIRSFSDDTLKAIGVVARKVLDGEASKDPLSRKVFDSILKFRQTVIPYSHLSEYEFMRARTLGYK